MSYLEYYYNNYDEEGRLLSRHGRVEYLTTMRYIQEPIAFGFFGFSHNLQICFSK